MKKKLFVLLLGLSIMSVPVHAEDTVISEQVIYDENDVKVTVTGYEPNAMLGVGIPILVENNSEKSIMLQVRNSSVNGCMVDFQVSVEVTPGKKANDEISILKSYLEKYGIEQVADIECSLHFFEPDTYATISDTPLLSIETNLTGKYEQEYDDSGDIIYDENGIKIVSQGIEESSIFGGPSAKLYMENNTGQNITIQVRDTSVNGFMLNPSFSSEIVSGKKRIDGIDFLPSELEANGIEKITELETSFHVFPTDVFSSTIVDTPAITINFDK